MLGYGNPGRQDDGLGAAAVAEIETLDLPNLTAYDNYQLNIEDSIELAAHDVVWFVDASRIGPAPYTVQELHPAAAIEFTSHVLRPEALLAITRQVFAKTPRAFLLGIRGYQFEFVEALTPAAAGNLHAAIAMLTGRIGSPAGPS